MALPVVVLDLQFGLTIHILAAKPLNGVLDLNCPCRFYRQRQLHRLISGQDARMWQLERIVISAVAKGPHAPSRDPANDLQNYLYHQATFQRTVCH